MTKRNRLPLTVVAIVLLALPWMIQAAYYKDIIIMTLMWITLASSWNLLGGYTGQVSLGHTVFFGVGAYSAGLLVHHLGVSPWWGILLGPVMAVIIGTPIGLICFRLRGPYFTLSLLALGEIFRQVALNWESLTNGAVGILIMRTWPGVKEPYYYIMLAITALCIYTCYRLIRSKFGYYFLAIREDQDAAEGLGIPTTKYKLYALIPSAGFTGLAGAFYMNYHGFIEPDIVFALIHISVMIVLCVMMGGAGTSWGPALGAVIYYVLNELLRVPLGPASRLVFGVIVCLVIMFLPNGIVGEMSHGGRLRGLFRRKKPSYVGGE